MDLPTALQSHLDLLDALATQLNVADFDSRCATVLATILNQMAQTSSLLPQQATRCIHMVAASQLDGPSRRTLIDGLSSLANPQNLQALKNCDILNIHHYLPAFVWDAMQDETLQYAAKVKVVLDCLEKWA